MRVVLSTLMVIAIKAFVLATSRTLTLILTFVEAVIIVIISVFVIIVIICSTCDYCIEDQLNEPISLLWFNGLTFAGTVNFLTLFLFRTAIPHPFLF